ncbi:MAG: type transport system permease protein [Chloroflexota bacterium]|nr:type transport system permease protein [Chloroflexota bacterium]
MKLRNVLTIARKDWLEVRQNKAAWIPMLIVPVIFVVILPLIFTVIIPGINVSPQDVINSDADITAFIEHMPPQLSQYVDFDNPMASMIVVMLGIMFAPMFLIMPLMFASTIAAESFAGERERKTIEALLYTPASDADLFVGKLVAAAVPSIGITWVSFLVYTLILNLVPYATFQRLWFPLPTWWPLIFWITPALAILSIAFTVLISARVQNFQGTYQLSSSLVLLVVALFAGQLTGFLYLSVGVEMLLGALFWGAAFFLVYLAVQTFNRASLITGRN